MRIIIIQLFGVAEKLESSGGGFKTIIRLANLWKSWGLRVTFFTIQSKEFTDKYLPEVECHHVKAGLFKDQATGLAKSIQYIIYGIRTICKFISPSEIRDAVILSASHYPSDLITTLAVSRMLRIRLIVTYFYHLTSAPWNFPFRRGGILRVTVNYTIQMFSLVLCKIFNVSISLMHPSEINYHGWKLGNEVIPIPGYLVEKFPITNHKRDYEGCYIGRISVPKGINDLLMAWKAVTLKFPKAVLLIGGSFFPNSYERKFKALVKELNLHSNIQYLGIVSDSEKKSIFKSCKVFVSPSYEEGWGLGVMEAASMGAVPVTYDLVAFDYLGPNRIVANTGNIESLSEKIIGLLSNENERISIQRHIKSEVDKYEIEYIAAQELDLFQKRLGSNTP